jgi:hypothetical protein
VVRRSRRLPQRRAAACRATRCAMPTPFSMRRRSRIRRSSPGRGRSACRSIASSARPNIEYHCQAEKEAAGDFEPSRVRGIQDQTRPRPRRRSPRRLNGRSRGKRPPQCPARLTEN